MVERGLEGSVFEASISQQELSLTYMALTKPIRHTLQRPLLLSWPSYLQQIVFIGTLQKFGTCSFPSAGNFMDFWQKFGLVWTLVSFACFSSKPERNVVSTAEKNWEQCGGDELCSNGCACSHDRSWISCPHIHSLRKAHACSFLTYKMYPVFPYGAPSQIMSPGYCGGAYVLYAFFEYSPYIDIWSAFEIAKIPKSNTAPPGLYSEKPGNPLLYCMPINKKWSPQTTIEYRHQNDSIGRKGFSLTYKRFLTPEDTVACTST